MAHGCLSRRLRGGEPQKMASVQCWTPSPGDVLNTKVHSCETGLASAVGNGKRMMTLNTKLAPATLHIARPPHAPRRHINALKNRLVWYCVFRTNSIQPPSSPQIQEGVTHIHIKTTWRRLQHAQLTGNALASASYSKETHVILTSFNRIMPVLPS